MCLTPRDLSETTSASAVMRTLADSGVEVHQGFAGRNPPSGVRLFPAAAPSLLDINSATEIATTDIRANMRVSMTETALSDLTNRSTSGTVRTTMAVSVSTRT